MYYKSRCHERTQEVQNRKKILKRIIDIVIYIGRQRISYRGKQEAAYSLTSDEENDGYFLELVKLIAKYDIILKQHVENSIKISERTKFKKGRDNMINVITFISKHFINEKMMAPIGVAIQHTIVKEIKECAKFSLMIHSTHDVSVMDQLAICVRYVFNCTVQERLLKLVICYDSSGTGLFNLIDEELKKKWNYC